MNNDLNNQLILIVEDVAFNRLLLREIFESSGFLNIEEAEDGKEALEKTIKLKPKIIILDLSMPVMDGFEYCKKVKEIKEFAELPIIVQTASSDSDEKARAFEAGATDFVAKPIDERELIARTKVHLERINALEELLQYRARTAQELEVAKQMQEFLMPSNKKINLVQSFFDIDLKHILKTSSETGGDFWGVDKISANELAIYVTDFAGHGVQAALNTFRIHTLMLSKKELMRNPARYMESLNNDLKELLGIGQYATMFYGLINFEKKIMTYVTAACPGPIIMTNDKFEVLDGKGFPLGMQKDSVYENKEVKIDKNMGIMLYSDALIETKNHETEEFLDINVIGEMKDEYVAKNGKLDKNFHDYVVKYFIDNYEKNIDDDLTVNFYFTH